MELISLKVQNTDVKIFFHCIDIYLFIFIVLFLYFFSLIISKIVMQGIYSNTSSFSTLSQ